MVFSNRFAPQHCPRSRSRSLRIETLESRVLLDAGGGPDTEGAALANDRFDLHQNGAELRLEVLANDQFDEEYQGARRITSISYGNQGGRIEIGDFGQDILYTPPADFSGTELFVYAVDGQFTAQVSVSIRAPLEFDQYVILPDGSTHQLNVLANDPFWPNYAGPGQITSVSVGSTGGTVVIGPDARTLLYTPAEGTIGSETFIYVVDEIYPARVTVDVAETLQADRYELVQHEPPATLQVLANDPFWLGYSGQRQITHLTESQIGAALEISADGQSILYTQPDDFTGGSWDSFRYIVDGNYEASVTLTLHRPVRDDRFEVDQNSDSFYYDVTHNDTYRDLAYVEQDVIDRVTSVTQPKSGGTVEIADDGQGVLYTPPAGFTGDDTFTYLADGAQKAVVRVVVNRPVRDDLIYEGVYQDTPGNLIDVLANDFLGNGYDGARQITQAGVGVTGSGETGETENGATVAIRDDGRAILYTPASGFTGEDRFTYTVDHLLEAVATVRVQPLAQPDSVEFCSDPNHAAYTIEVLTNDHFTQGYLGPGLLSRVELVQGSGQAALMGDTTVLFAAEAAGRHQLRYTVDGQYEATVSIWIANHLDPDQLVLDQNASAHELRVLANDFQPDPHYVRCKSQNYLGARKITGATQSEHGGTVAIGDNGYTVWYTPPADFHGRDSFNYTVDDFMTETVTVEVIRRVRDDQFRVDAEDGSQWLPVLVNDLFGANYAGTGVITGVTVPSEGGVAMIADDGQSIIYTPPDGFIGTDSFIYTVDGALKADVHIVVDRENVVGGPVGDGLSTFGSFEAFHQFLVDDALQRYGYLFGTTAWNFEFFTAGTDFAGRRGGDERNHSETNVQVAGVDEGDIVEFDSDYLYLLTDDGAVIVDAGYTNEVWSSEQFEVASRVAIEGRPVVEYLHGDRLTVISETVGQFGNGPILLDDNGFLTDTFRGDSFWQPVWLPLPNTTIVTVIDVSDRTNPAIIQTVSMEGRYVDSRGVEDQVYLLLDGGNAVGPRPEIVDEDDDPKTPGRYETRAEYVDRVNANPGQFVDEALPNYTVYAPDGEMVRTGLLSTPGEIYRPIVANGMNLISVVSLNVESDQPGLTDTSAIYGTGAGTIYASLKNFYVFDQDWSAEDGAVTRIVKFDWDPATGGVEFAATTAVAGTILNQFSADENGDYLRIATTIGNRYSGNWSGRDENGLFVLQEDEGVFEMVGSLQNLALDETMRSVRFFGDRALVTTFRNIDPLFALDLSDPANPEAVGHLTLPGFTSYMHLVGQDHLLTVGRNTPTGTSGPTQVALFDITNFAQPRRIAEYTFSRFSTSEAELDHHAFGYYVEHGLLGMPVTSRSIERVDKDGDGYRETSRWVEENRLAVFSVDVSAADPAGLLDLVGEIEHDTPVRRSGYIGDLFFSVAHDSVKVADVSDPESVIAELVVVAPDQEDSVVGVQIPNSVFNLPLLDLTTRETPALETRRDDPVGVAAKRARAYLARTLDLEIEAPLVVTAEVVPRSLGGGFSFVLQVGNEYTLVRSSDTGWVWRIETDFAFTGAAHAWHAVDPAIAMALESLPGDTDRDTDIDGADFLAWQRSLGSTTQSEANGDHRGVNDLSDLAVWQSGFGSSAAITSVTQGDFDLNLKVDGADFLAWQRFFGALASGTSEPISDGDHLSDGDLGGNTDADDLAVWADGFGSSMVYLTSVPGDANLDLDVDGADFLAWQRTFGASADEPVDGNDSGTVDAGDLATWEATFGTQVVGLVGQGSSSAAVISFASGSLSADSRSDRNGVASTLRDEPHQDQSSLVLAGIEAFWRHLPRHAYGTADSTSPREILFGRPDTTADRLLRISLGNGEHRELLTSTRLDRTTPRSPLGRPAASIERPDDGSTEIDSTVWDQALATGFPWSP